MKKLKKRVLYSVVSSFFDDPDFPRCIDFNYRSSCCFEWLDSNWYHVSYDRGLGFIRVTNLIYVDDGDFYNVHEYLFAYKFNSNSSDESFDRRNFDLVSYNSYTRPY